MKRGIVKIFYGDGEGKTTAAVGGAVKAVSQGKNVVIIQFLKGNQCHDSLIFHNLEPQIRWFTFEKSDQFYEQLSEEEKREEAVNIHNGMNFARKVLAIRDADVVILDEVLGLFDNQLITVEDIKQLVDAMEEQAELVLTGRFLPDGLLELADKVSHVQKVK